MEDELKKTYKIFISHSPEDVDYVAQIAKLLIGMGLNNTQIFCTSLPGYEIPEDTDIFDYLMDQHSEYELHVIFVHSDNYYKSTISLNEMGVAWALRSEATSFLLPGFGGDKLTGVVNRNTVSVKIYEKEEKLKNQLNQFCKKIANEFGLMIDDLIWGQNRNSFVKEIQKLNGNQVNRIELTKEAALLLNLAIYCESDNIIKRYDYPNGIFIENNEVILNVEYDMCENTRWNNVLEELLRAGFLNQFSAKRPEYGVTGLGYYYWDIKWAEYVLFNMPYDEYVISLLIKYGKVPGDYYTDKDYSVLNGSIMRTDEGLFVHHIDEDKIPGLTNMTEEKISRGAADYNKAERLVYCHLVEHMILHMKIIEKELTKKERDRFMGTSPLGIYGFVSITSKINYLFTGFKVNDDSDFMCLTNGIKNFFSDSWITYFVKAVKYFVEKIENRVEFQKWYSERRYLTSRYGDSVSLDEFLKIVHKIYDANPIGFKEMINMRDYNGIRGTDFYAT